MSVTDHERRVLFDRLEAVLGPTEAAVLMELLPPVGWADVARRGDIAELRGEVHGMFPRLVAANIASMVGVAGLVLAAGAVL